MLVPGLGQVYNGQLRRGVVMCLLMILLPAALLVWVLVEGMFFLWIAAPMLLLLGIHMWIITEASLVSRRLSADYQLRPCNRIAVYVVYSLVVVVGFHLAQWAVGRWCFEIHRVEASMETMNLVDGDYLLINRLAYGITNEEAGTVDRWWRDPGHGGAVLYVAADAGSPVRPGRCLGLPGESVETRGDMIVVQGFAVRGGMGARVQWIEPLAPGAIGRQVPEGHVCVLSDRPANGPLTEPILEIVPHARLIGKPMLIFWSVQHDRRLLRADRIGLPVF